MDEPGFLDDFVKIYAKHRCRFYLACDQMGVSTSTIREARLTKPEFDAALEKEERLLAEQIESGLVDEALNPDGNIVAKIFWLKNNWKEKYGEKQVFEVQPGQLWFEQKPVLEIGGNDTPDTVSDN